MNDAFTRQKHDHSPFCGFTCPWLGKDRRPLLQSKSQPYQFLVRNADGRGTSHSRTGGRHAPTARCAHPANPNEGFRIARYDCLHIPAMRRRKKAGSKKKRTPTTFQCREPTALLSAIQPPSALLHGNPDSSPGRYAHDCGADEITGALCVRPGSASRGSQKHRTADALCANGAVLLLLSQSYRPTAPARPPHGDTARRPRCAW